MYFRLTSSRNSVRGVTAGRSAVAARTFLASLDSTSGSSAAASARKKSTPVAEFGWPKTRSFVTEAASSKPRKAVLEYDTRDEPPGVEGLMVDFRRLSNG